MSTFIAPITSIGSLDTTEALQPQKQAGSSFQNILAQAASELEAADNTSTENTTALAMGDMNNIAQLQIDALKTQTLLQTTVQLTTRTVNAYKEIMQMQI